MSLCREIAAGALVKDAAKALGTTAGQIREWVADDKELAALYTRAREDQAHAIAEQAIAMADAAVPGKFGDVDKVRLQVDTRKWMASKIAPRTYGERVDLTSAGDKLPTQALLVVPAEVVVG